jgi:hypothetical protein
MKKPISEEALRQEAAFWEAIKQAAMENPGRSCHK